VRFDPSKKGSPIDIWLKGSKVQSARVVDAYSNCFVKRNNEVRQDDSQGRPPAAVPGLRLRDLGRDDEEKR
jgi:hypothetical protein